MCKTRENARAERPCESLGIDAGGSEFLAPDLRVTGSACESCRKRALRVESVLAAVNAAYSADPSSSSRRFFS
jgi:hypothetical protein